MPERTLALSRFLATYKQLLIEIRTLARMRTVAPSGVIDALLEQPFAVPSSLHGARGASAVTSALQSLAEERATVDADPATIDASMEALVRDVLTARGSRKGAMRGGDAVDIVAVDDDVVRAAGAVAGGLVREVSVAETHRGQRAKPPGGDAAPDDVSEPAVAPRWINAEIDDHDAKEPLSLDDTYTIAFGVDVAKGANAVGAAEVAENVIFPKGIDEVELTVDLRSNDFEIKALRQSLKLKRTGKSAGKARFGITAKHEGRCELTATIHKERNFVQEMTIAVSVGATDAAPPTTTSVSRSPSTVPRVLHREVMIVMKPESPSGYDFWARDERGAKSAHLEVQPDELSGAITAARDALLAVVAHADANGADVFQTEIDIASPDANAALRIMASAGAELFRLLFWHPPESKDVSDIGLWLRDLASETGEPMSIQIMSKQAPIPWALLYTGDASDDATLDWKSFLGFRHIIEQLPLVDQLGRGGASIASKPELAVSINLNRQVDKETHAKYVEQQEKFWAAATTDHTRLRVTPRTESKPFLKALADGTTADQVLYFYGHAETKPPSAKGGASSSSLTLTDGKVTLASLYANASTSIKLLGNPLVFINACESAEMSPLFYDGFVPYFMAKGARGVIGTECRTPARFAAEWAKRFFERFLNGEPIGALFLGLRTEFLEQHGNPLGLLYAVHCDGDTQITPAL
ncbi:MAG: CHAT domain-containing protein [Gemmatimonadaceae bacterium]